MSAVALDQALAAALQPASGGSPEAQRAAIQGMGPAFQKRLAAVVDAPWSIATSEDIRRVHGRGRAIERCTGGIAQSRVEVSGCINAGQSRLALGMPMPWRKTLPWHAAPCALCAVCEPTPAHTITHHAGTPESRCEAWPARPAC